MKRDGYAGVGIPVHLLIDRGKGAVVVNSAPMDGTYRLVRIHPYGSVGRRAPGQSLPYTAASRTFFCTYKIPYSIEESRMRTLTYTESRANYAKTLDAVVDDREEVIVTRAGREPVVIVALAEYESLKETAYLLRSPENARRLLASIDRLENGGGTVREPVE